MPPLAVAVASEAAMALTGTVMGVGQLLLSAAVLVLSQGEGVSVGHTQRKSCRVGGGGGRRGLVGRCGQKWAGIQRPGREGEVPHLAW